jgi:hypothetical protein
MKIFNHKNPRHMQILKEELARAKRILTEGFSADRIWALMTPDERKTAISTTDDASIDLADQYAENEWDNVPADLQDQIDLSEYELAMDDQQGRSLLRGIKSAITENPEKANEFIKKFLKKIGRKRLEDITIDQATKLNIGIYQYIRPESTDSTTSTLSYNPRDLPSGAPSKNRDWRGGMWTGD